MPVYKQKGSEIWYTNFRHGGRRVRVATGESDKRKAQHWEDAHRVELRVTVPLVKGTGQAQTLGTALVPGQL